MATARARHGSYIFRRPGSSNWYIQLRSGGKRTEISLGTADKAEAELLAAPKIEAHKAALLAARPRIVVVPHKLTPGEHTGEDGGRVVATEREIIYFAPDGKLIRTEPNGPTQALENLPMGAVLTFGTKPTPAQRQLGPVIDVTKLERAAVRSGSDDTILTTYLDHRGITGYDRKEAETVWALYQSLIGKPLKDATRDDGRKLAKHFQDAGNKSATINKKIGWLRAAVELAIDEGKLKFNAFRNVTPDLDDELEKVPLDDADMRACKKALGNLSDADALLFRVCATTGMRLSEAYQISGEKVERGIRYCIIGEKTDQSRRRVPFPATLLPHLPAKIAKPLFAADTKDATIRRETRAASKRLNLFLDNCGIDDPTKTFHSLRHRAQDRLRAAGCPQDIREELLGHSELTVGEGYGIGHPVRMLKLWADKINGI